LTGKKQFLKLLVKNMGQIRVNGDIENNKKYKDIMDKYLKSPRFSDRCVELKKAIREIEIKEKKEKELLRKGKTIEMFR